MSEPLKQYYLSFVLYRRSITKWADMRDVDGMLEQIVPRPLRKIL